MRTKIYIPVIDTDSKTFEYKGEISYDDYDEMVYEHFRKTDRMVDNYVNRDSGYDEYREDDDKKNDDYVTVDSTEGYHLMPCDALIDNPDNDTLNEDELIGYAENGKMFIVIMDINPETIDYDSVSELRYWINDSKRVIEDEELDEKTILKTLPKTHFGIELNNKIYMMNGCKLFEDYSRNGHPYNFALLVEKINSL